MINCVRSRGDSAKLSLQLKMARLDSSLTVILRQLCLYKYSAYIYELNTLTSRT